VDFIRGYGSDTTYTLMQALDVAFNASTGCSVTGNTGRADGLTSNPDSSCTPPAPLSQRGPENWDHDVGITMYPVGSGNGITTLNQFGNSDFCGGSVNQPYPASACGYAAFEYARSSRARKSSDNTGLRFVAYAKDAIPWVNWRSGTAAKAAGPAAGVTNLTQQNVRDIFVNCTVTKWSDASLATHPTNNFVGQAADNIIIWADQSGSGTRSTFDGFLGSGSNSTQCIPAAFKDGDVTNGERVIFENNASPIVNCATYAGGSCDPTDGANTYLSSVYYFAVGPYNAQGKDANGELGNGANLGSIDGIAPSSANIENGTFPYSRQLYNVYRNTYASNNIPVPALDYIGETGFICKGSATGSGLPDAVVVSNGDTDSRGGHITDPLTGKNYATEITGDTQAATAYPSDGVIKTTGFVPISFGAIGGGVAGNSHCRVS
jgi:hypothetical protein